MCLGLALRGRKRDHYLNPVVPENYTNSGTLGDFSVNYQRDLTPNDRLNFIARYELSRYLLPNEIVQQTWCYPPGQTDRSALPAAKCQQLRNHGVRPPTSTFSRPRWLAMFRSMVRNNGNDFYSNALSTPIILFQHNWFNEVYFKGMVTIDHGRNEWKMGVESDNTFLHENFNYIITDPSQFDDNTALTFSFPGRLPQSRPASRPGAVGVRAGPDSHGQLDDERGPALGPLSAGR